MQKSVYLFFFLFAVTALAGHAQHFKGRIHYQNTFKDLSGKDITGPLVDYLGKEQQYYISGRHYKAYNENNQLIQLYEPETNVYYLIGKGKAPEKFDAATVTSQKHVVTRLTKTEKVAGYACKAIQVETDQATIVYYYSPKVKVDPAPFARHHMGEWNQYLEATGGCLPLKYVMTNRTAGYVITSTATEVEPLPLTEADFKLPANLVAAATFEKGDSFDYGQLEGQTYRNTFFGLTMQVPEGWHVQSNEQKKALLASGKQLAAGDDANMQALLKASEVKTASLLVVFQHEKGAPVDYNPAFTLVAENIAASPGVKTGNDYLFHARKMMEKGQLQYTFGKDVYNITIGGRDFAVLETSLDFNGVIVNQRYYVTVLKQFSLVFISSFQDEAQLRELEKVANSMQFE